MEASGSWKQELWCSLMVDSAALMSLIAFGSTTGPRSMRPWNSRPSVWPRFLITKNYSFALVTEVLGIIRHVTSEGQPLHSTILTSNLDDL